MLTERDKEWITQLLKEKLSSVPDADDMEQIEVELEDVHDRLKIIEAKLNIPEFPEPS